MKAATPCNCCLADRVCRVFIVEPAAADVAAVVIENADTKIEDDDDDRQSILVLNILERGGMIDIIIKIAVIAWISRKR